VLVSHGKLEGRSLCFDGSVHLSAWLLEVLGGEETKPGLISRVICHTTALLIAASNAPSNFCVKHNKGKKDREVRPMA